MEAQKRFTGIDLFRGLAVYAVIILHIDEGLAHVPFGWAQITNFAFFCVPFFLAIAFYLAINKLYVSQHSYPLGARLARLLIPYGIWSVFYLLYKSAKYGIVGDFDKLSTLFQDPLSLIFFGGISFHLYFLPLLATGTLLVKLAEILIKRKVTLGSLGLIFFISILIYAWILISDNGLRTPANYAFEPLLATIFPGGNANPFFRWMFVEFFWVLRCLPYVMLAMLLGNPRINKPLLRLTSQHAFLWVVLFLVCNLFGALILPQAVDEVLRGYSALLAAIALSANLKETPILRNIGLCSFGIYLVHMFFVEVFQSVAVRVYPNYVNSISAPALLMASALVFLISWATTALILKNKLLSQSL